MRVSCLKTRLPQIVCDFPPLKDEIPQKKEVKMRNYRNIIEPQYICKKICFAAGMCSNCFKFVCPS